MFKKGNTVNSGRTPWNKGIKHTPEARNKMSVSRKEKGTSDKQLEVLRRMSEGNKGRVMTEKQRQAIRKANLGVKKSESTKAKISRSLTGRKGHSKGVPKSEDTKRKIRLSLTGKPSPNRGKKRPEISGRYHWNWRGGRTSDNESIRKSVEYRLWRTSVFERDKYTCVFCGKKGGTLNADHVKPFAYFPELRFAIDNGRTLCVGCHRKTDTYAGRSVSVFTKKDL